MTLLTQTGMQQYSSSLRKLGSMLCGANNYLSFSQTWIPAFAGMTI
jgi:hypothetical protein